ncbi:hypothetical protein G4D82_00475 [Flavobacterium sp. CYK-4]|uniref:hypothetical protein n=1 Tax=Flavobacterium lotistagni TaxID=2709660 RepID=UPI0014087060|nr:hypothetical protein [Flavobacterium lotistagni]NHM05683.1 hypothetical protein [Flavobacterium lotistagni]
MQHHFDLTDSQFEQQFAACALPSEVFNHEAHLRLAWIHIQKYGLETAVSNITQQIKAYATFLGEAEIYHHTLTVAAVYIVNHFKLQSGTADFTDFMAQNPRLQTHFKELIAQHYSTDIFNDAKAKAEFLPPDLLPF